MKAETAALFVVGFGLLLWMSNAGASEDVATAGDNNDVPVSTDGAFEPIPQATTTGDPMDNQIAAFLAVVRQFESNNDYNVLYGGGYFVGFERHPNKRIPINLPGYEGKFSTAAGAYQINFPTYSEFAPKLGITDFSPASQDAIALAILNACGAVAALSRGNIEDAFISASKRWASLPGSTAGQHPQAMQTALSAFADNGGGYA